MPQQWVTNHADYLYSYAFSRLSEEEQARDLVQETFLAGLEKLHAFEGKSNERTWLTSILKHKIVDVYRKKASGLRAVTETKDAEAAQTDFFDAVTGHWNQEHFPHEFLRQPDGHLLTKEFNNILQQCLQRLPSLWMAVFTMKHLDEAPTGEICRDMKLTTSNFWVIIHRAKVNLRACLQKNWS